MMPKVLRDFENDAKTQVRFHLFMAWGWLFTMFGVVFTPALWSHSLGILVVLEVSLYANFATEYGSLAAAQASLKSDSI